MGMQGLMMVRAVLLLISLLLCTIAALGENNTAIDETSKIEDWLENLDITPDILDKLTSDNKTVVTATAVDVLKNHLQKKGISLSLSPDEARFSQSLPNQCQDENSCGCRVESRDVQVYAAIKRSSSFSSTNNMFQESGIFLEAKIDAEIGANGNIRAKAYGDILNYIKGRKKRSPGFGKRFKKAFKKVVRIPKKVVKKVVQIPKKITKELIDRPLEKLRCKHLIRKTVGFNLVSTGVVKLGISLSLGDVSFTEAEGGMVLSFVPTFDILGQVVSWNLDQVRICLIVKLKAKSLD